MVKLRQAGYCNLKLLLLYLVIYGHWIEGRIHSDTLLLTQCRLIYLIHMPLFAFLSGLFSKSAQGCARQIRRLLPIYTAAQGLCVVLEIGEILTPVWHLWYLLSSCAWAGAAWLWYRFGRGQGRRLILFLAILLGLTAGCVPWLGRTLSGSRTVALFPFFWAGVICPADISWRKFRLWALAALGAAGILFCSIKNAIPIDFLYFAEPYVSTGGGAMLRLACYALSGLFGFFLLAWMPEVRFPWTRAGADTLLPYLLHAPLVGILREVSIPWPLCALGSGVLIYILYKLTQWHAMYGITPGERRDRLWPRSRTSMNPTQSPYTGSSSP